MSSSVSHPPWTLTIFNTEIYLDNDAYVNWTFVKKLFDGSKSSYKLTQIRRVELPRWDELSMKVLLPMALSDPELMRYLRDDVAESGCISRTFLVNIINTHYPSYLPFVIKEQTKARHGSEAAAAKGEDVKMTTEWVQALSGAVFSDK